LLLGLTRRREKGHGKKKFQATLFCTGVFTPLSSLRLTRRLKDELGSTVIRSKGKQ